MSARALALLLAAVIAGAGGGAADAARLPRYTVTLSAPHRSYRQLPVRVVVPSPKQPTAFGVVAVTDLQTKRRIACQGAPLSLAETEVSWLMDELAQGATRRYRIAFTTETRPYGEGFVGAQASDEAVEVTLDGDLFTRYRLRGAPKPYCYPIIGPTGVGMTRGYPMENLPGEPHDHPHHRSLWFTFGEVNGVDFWAEGSGKGTQVHRLLERVESGPMVGIVRAVVDWIGPDGKKVCEDVRELRVYRVPEGRLFDLDVTLRASEGPLEFGDTKEGMLGFRVAQTMQLAGGQGHIVNSTGLKDGEAWGKPAAWCDYSGPVGGQVVGVAIFDHPGNLRHPTYWHVRDYGLFAANPFGRRDFTGDRSGAGRYSLAKGAELTFRYRFLLHRGPCDPAAIQDAFAQYADPPGAQVRPD